MKGQLVLGEQNNDFDTNEQQFGTCTATWST